jgi:hypothetical protein
LERTHGHDASYREIMALNLVYDKLITTGIGFPNLALHDAIPFTPAWRQFDRHWPWVVPLRLTLYLDHWQIPYQCCQAQSAQTGWYPIALSWFDFSIDYFDLVPAATLDRVRQGFFRILFYYHEGDNPQRMQTRLQDLAAIHAVRFDQFRLISANTAAQFYFSEHECFFHYVNHKQHRVRSAVPNRDFTLLNRQHKWWRASIVADLERSGLLTNSAWSYDTAGPAVDDPCDNPISIFTIEGLPQYLEKFMHDGPYVCDNFDSEQQNDHHWVNATLYGQSFFHIVVETHFDADQSTGTFVTEKTWKCIKYGQPFIMVAPAGTLQHLRDLGYRTFDHVLDNSYDMIQDPTQRWLAIKKLIADIKHAGLQDLWARCQSDVDWNSLFFEQHVRHNVNSLTQLLT